MLLSSKADFVGRAKTCVARWFDHSGDKTPGLRSETLRGVELIARELANRADRFEVMTVGLDGGRGLPIRINGQRHQAFPCARCLAVSSVVPGWGFGWGNVLQNEDVYDVLCWFLRYGTQYIHRSNIAIVLMIAWEEHGKILHPCGSMCLEERYGPIIPMSSVDQVLGTSKQRALAEWGNVDGGKTDGLTSSAWTGRNTMDPFIHQAIFHYLVSDAMRARARAKQNVS